MTTRRRPVAAGAIAATVLLLAATACSSGSDDATGESLPAPAVDAAGSTGSTAPGIDTPADNDTDTDTPTDTDTAAPTPGDTGSDDTGSGDDPTTGAVVVPEALRFTAPLVGGGTFDGAAVAGKPTVFWFWAPT